MEAEPQLLPVVYTLDYSNRSYMLSLSLSQLNSYLLPSNRPEKFSFFVFMWIHWTDLDVF